MELERYAKIIWKWLWLILLSAAVAGVSSYLATRSAPRIYRTSTTIMIGQFIKDPDPNSGDFWVSQQLGQTYAQLAVRQPVLQGALAALGLADHMSWQALVENVAVTLVPGTQLMEIAVNDTNPQRAKALADSIAQELILQSPSNPSSDEGDRRAFANQQMNDLEVKIDEAEAELEELQEELDASISARQIQDLQTQINTLQDKVSSWQSSYAQFLTFLQGGEVNYLSVVEPAPVPTTPVAPNVMANIGLAVAIGATLAVAAAFLLETIDDTIKSGEDVRHISPLPVIGNIVRVNGVEADGAPVAAKSPNSPAVEAYRALRTNLQLSSGILSRPATEKGTWKLVVTSPSQLEGKSTTAANLAIVMAQSGLSTILVDADLRRPILHDLFHLPKAGLTEALLEMNPIGRNHTDNSAVNKYLQETFIQNLRVMTSGHLPPNPADLLGSGRMHQLIQLLETEADLVIFDTPPAAIVTDAVILAARVDGVVLVARQGQTRRAAFKRAVEALQRAETPIVGVVLNCVTDRADGYSYYRYASDGREGDSGPLRPVRQLLGTRTKDSTKAE